MGYDADAIRRVVRISGGAATNSAEWEALLVAFVESYLDLKKSAGEGSVISI